VKGCGHVPRESYMKIEVDDGTKAKKVAASAREKSKKSIAVSSESSESTISVRKKVPRAVQAPRLATPTAASNSNRKAQKKLHVALLSRILGRKVPKVSLATRAVILIASVGLTIIAVEEISAEMSNKLWSEFLTPFNVVILVIGVLFTLQYAIPSRK